MLPYSFLLVQAHLSGGEWIELLEPKHPGIAEVKWCRNRFRPFLCIDPQVPSCALHIRYTMLPPSCVVWLPILQRPCFFARH